MKAKIVFCESTFTFAERYKRYIKEVVEGTIKHAGHLLKLGWDIKCEIQPVLGPVSQRGSAISKKRIRLFIPLLGIVSSKELKSRIYHELHHLARGFYYYKEDGEINSFSLISAIFSEGLAVTFEMENISHYTSGFSGCDPIFLQKFLIFIKARRDMGYNNNDWFDRVGVGYWMGKYFIDLILARYPYLNSINLVKSPTAELLDLLSSSGIDLR